MSAERIAAVRRFNRFYTRKIGVLQEGLLRSTYSLTEVRVLYELAHREGTTATELGGDLGLDQGYLSRILRVFHRRGLLSRKAGKSDARQTFLSLTKRGRKVFAALDKRSSAEIAAMLEELSDPEQRRLVGSMAAIETILGDHNPEESVPYVLRPHQPGDMGWVVYRHGVLYAQEYGWDERFEALVADIVARFIERFDPKRERCWIAERDGQIVGFVFLVKKSRFVSQLRLMLVEPEARGLGIGTRLVEECIRFARQVGYRKMVLWTNSVLTAARHIYAKAGFKLVKSEPHSKFGPDLIAETWELEL